MNLIHLDDGHLEGVPFFFLLFQFRSMITELHPLPVALPSIPFFNEGVLVL